MSRIEMSASRIVGIKLSRLKMSRLELSVSLQLEPRLSKLDEVNLVGLIPLRHIPLREIRT